MYERHFGSVRKCTGAPGFVPALSTARAMGLFGDLPSAKRAAPETTRDASPAPKRVAVAENDHAEDDAPSDTTKNVRDEDAARMETQPARTPKTANHAEALDRLAAHVGNPSKFKRASALAVKLMRSGELERKHGTSVFAILEASMRPPSRAIDPGTRFEYRELFDAAVFCADRGVLSAAHQKRVRAYLVYVRVVNDAYTDDPFEFARVAKEISSRIEALPAYDPPPPEIDEPVETREGLEERRSAEVTHRIDLDRGEARVRGAERSAEMDDRGAAEETGEALVIAFQSACSRYDKTWAQTTVDVLVDAVCASGGASESKFSPAQRARVERIAVAAREKRVARKAAAAGGERVASFDRDSAFYANAAVSVRRGVGGEGTRYGRGESGVR